MNLSYKNTIFKIWLINAIIFITSIFFMEIYKEGDHIFDIFESRLASHLYYFAFTDAVIYSLPFFIGILISPLKSIKTWNNIAAPLILNLWIQIAINIFLKFKFYNDRLTYEILVSYTCSAVYNLHSWILSFSFIRLGMREKYKAIQFISFSFVGIVCFGWIFHSQIEQYGFNFLRLFFNNVFDFIITIIIAVCWFLTGYFLLKRSKETTINFSPLIPSLTFIIIINLALYLEYLI